MKRTSCNRIATAVLAIAFPVAALADLSATKTVPVDNNLNLETGVVAVSGGDVDWAKQGTQLEFVGTAKGVVFPGTTGATAFAGLTQAILQALTSLESPAPIPASSLPVGAIVAVQTNAGHAAKLLVTAVSSSSITLQFTTFGAAGGTGGGPTPPTITAVQNNSSRIPAGFPNSGVAPSSLVVLLGGNLANSNDLTLQDSTKAGGIPTTLNGATLSISAGGKTFTPGMYYASPTQIDFVLPAAVPVGSATVTVTFSSVASSPFTFQVVASAPGLDSYTLTPNAPYTPNGTGVATDAFTGALVTFTSSAKVSQVLTLWLTGLGANPAVSDVSYTPGASSVNVQVQVLFGSVPGTVGYAGSGGYPGVNQINVTVPSGVAFGCYVSLAIVVNGNIVSNIPSLPTEQNGGECSDSIFGTSGSQISTISGKGTVNSGDLFVTQSTAPAATGTGTTTTTAAVGIFEQVSGASTFSSSSVSLGSCNLNQTVVVTGTLPTIVGLNPGTITMTGPSGPVTLKTIPQVPYLFEFGEQPGEVLPAISSSGGSFVFNGSGGSTAPAVGPFSNVSVNFASPLFSWTNQNAAASITRSSGLTVTWTGGGSGTWVEVGGTSTSGSVSASYTCIFPQSASTGTIPGYILDSLPSGTGTTTVENSTPFTSFQATGLDYGIAFGAISYQVKSTYQ
jgi:uncharacterized protein (TIGR03437 family)